MNTTEVQIKTLFYEVLRSQVKVAREEVLVDVKKQLLKSGRFIALRGKTGGGKSYFLRHQLVPHFEALEHKEVTGPEGQWRVISFSPQVNPIGTLAQALATPGKLKPEGAVPPFYQEEIEKVLRSGKDGLIDVYNDAVSTTGKRIRLVIIVDQLEDMFKMGDELKRKRTARYEGLGKYFQPGDDASFFSLFSQVLNTEIPIYLVFSIGSENLDRINAYQGWPALISTHRYSLPRITTREMQEVLLAQWPDEELDSIPEGSTKLFEEILRDYKKIFQSGREPVARMNIVMKLLYARSTELLDRPFTVLSKPPPFIQKIITSDKQPSEKASALRTAFLRQDNRIKWAEYITSLSSNEEQAWNEAVGDFFNQLVRYYEKIGRMQGAPNYLFDSLFKDLPPEYELMTSRLFQTITIKDPSPDRVAESYSTPYNTLEQVCTRKGEDYPKLLNQLNYGIGFPDKKPPALDKENLRTIIRHFNFPGGTIPDLVRWIDPAGQSVGSDRVMLHDKMIIKLGTSDLVQEWEMLADWIDDEFAAASIYKKFVQDARLYFEDEINPKNNNEESSGTETPDLPTPSLWRDSLDKLTGMFNQLWFRKKDEGAPKEKQNRLLLTEGGVEMVGEWYVNTLPNAAWGSKYRREEIEFDEDGKPPSAFRQWVNDGAWTAFALANAFWKKSYDWHQAKRKNAEAAIKRQIKFQRKFSLLMGGLATVAVICMSVALYLGWKANISQTNLRLLDFVDSMSKTNLIPEGIYRSGEFRELKDRIEKDNSVRKNEDVIAILAEANVLKLPSATKKPRYSEISSNALLHLGTLVDDYHLENTKAIVTLTEAIDGTKNQALSYNIDSSGVNYQFPYVYSLLWENYGAMRTAILSRNHDHGNTLFAGHTDERGMVLKTPARISAVVSNPKVTDQYAVADAGGRVRILFGDNEVFERVKPIPESISSLQYSSTGRELYATTYGGNIYRYEPVSSILTRQSPFGLTDSLSWTRLDVCWGSRGDGLAILSVHNTANPNCLLVVGDTDVTLIRKSNRRSCDYSSWRGDNFPLGGDLTALTVARGNEEGSLFLIGGSNASELMYFNEGTDRMERLRTVFHENISVSAIAFQPSTAPATAPPKIAVGTETGDIWLTDISGFQATGTQQDHLMEVINNRTARVGNVNFQESAITGLSFNKTDNEQLISSSLDGTVWMFNLDGVIMDTHYFLDKESGGADWDHLRLITSGRSIDNLCLVNNDEVVAVENNLIRNWPTNLKRLFRQLEETRLDYHKID